MYKDSLMHISRESIENLLNEVSTELDKGKSDNSVIVKEFLLKLHEKLSLLLLHVDLWGKE